MLKDVMMVSGDITLILEQRKRKWRVIHPLYNIIRDRRKSQAHIKRITCILYLTNNIMLYFTLPT